MRDPRLLPPGAVNNLNAMREATDQLLGSASDRRELDGILVAWWVDVLAQDSASDDWEAEQAERLRRICSSLPSSIRGLGLFAPAALLRQVHDAEYSAGAILLGESAASVVRRDPTGVDQLDRAIHMLADCWEAIETLMDALTREPAWPPTPELLSPYPATLDKLVGRLFNRRPSNDVLIEEEKKARTRGLLAYHGGRYYNTIDLDLTALVRLTLLSRRDWECVALLVEKLPLRALRKDLWRHLHLHEDRDSILSLLAAAPSVFEDDEWSGHTSALDALKAAIAHADRLYGEVTRESWPQRENPEEEIEALVEQELPDWMEEVVEVARARPDGRSLLYFFAASVIRAELRASAQQHQWSSARIALGAIHNTSTIPTVEEMKRIARLGVARESTNIDYSAYVITAAAFDADANEVWSWYRGLLLKSDHGFCRQASEWRRGLCYEVLAERLRQLRAPLDEWGEVWRALFVTDRERARFETRDHEALFPSVHLLRVGAQLLRISPELAGARQFFDEIRMHTHSLLANDTRLVSPLSPYLEVDAIDVAPIIMGAAWPEALEAQRPMLETAKNRIYVAALLLEGGTPFSEVAAAIETSSHRLSDSAAEVKNDVEVDFGIRRLAEFVSAEAEAHARPEPQ